MFLTRLWCTAAGRPAPARSDYVGPGALRQAVRSFGQPLDAGPGRGTRFLLCVSVLLVLGWPVPGIAQPMCTAMSTAITDIRPDRLGMDPNVSSLVADCNTLLGLKSDLQGTEILNWAESTAMDTWNGITVYRFDSNNDEIPPRVTRLSFFGEGLGTIPDTLGGLTGLREIYLNNNQLTGTIPDTLGNLSNLTRINLHQNQLTGAIPTELNRLTALQRLFLHDNQLTGSIPDLSALTALKELTLDRNHLTGSIPASLNRLTALVQLSLHTNQLTGSIPDLSALTALERLYLYTNQLTGSIPASLNRLTTLQQLSLSVNQLSGRIPDLSNLDNLEILYLRNNQLTGSIPASLGGLDVLTQLSIRNNQLSGDIPAALDGTAPRGESRAGVPGVGYLENPGPNAFQSGVGVISGWACEADEVEVAIGHLGRQLAAYGTERLDTLDACGDTDNGFGLLFNWNLLGDGEHEVAAFVDGEELGRATVRVTTVGEGEEAEFLRGAAGECVAEDFPALGQTVTLEWQQNSQNFVITEVQ